MRHPCVLILSALLAGCASFGKPAPVAPSEALSLEYNLPVTSVRMSMDLLLVDCTGDRLTARPTVALQPASNPNLDPGERFRIHSTALSSWTRNKQIAMELHPNGALKSVNGGVADRTGAIITNVLKTALSILPMFDPGAISQVPTRCNAQTRRALAQVTALQTRIDALRSTLPAATPARAGELRLAIDALAAEVARLRTEQLLITLTKDLDIPRTRPVEHVISWTGRDLARWLEPAAAGTAPLDDFQLVYCLSPVVAPVACPMPGTVQVTPVDPQPARCLQNCSETIVLREPVIASMTVAAASNDFVRLVPGASPVPIAAGAALQRTTVPVAQWGSLSYIPLRAGFGESNSFAVGLDEFGRRHSFAWKSDARGEGITGSLASIADAGAKLEAALRNQDLVEQQAEITRLQTLQTLNKLRFCREVIEAGGFTCPAS